MSSPCRNCGSKSTFPSKLYDDQRWNERIQYHKCLHCLVEFHTLLSDPIEWYTSGAYRAQADISEERARRITSHRCQRQIKWVDKHYPDWRSEVGSILDIGAYQGIAVTELRSQGFEAVGYDPDLQAAGHSEHVFTEVSDIGNVDMLWMSHVLEHTSAIDMLKQFKSFASKAFIEIPPGNYQLPHILVFQMDAVLRTIELADTKATKIDGGMRAILEW